ncbi:MAG: hypothetical protein V3T17_14380 [Pseudomonadales bacterium]
MVTLLCFAVLFFYSWHQFSQWGRPSSRKSFCHDLSQQDEFSPYFSTAIRYGAAAFAYCSVVVFLYGLLLFSVEVLIGSVNYPSLPLWLFIVFIGILPQLPVLGNGLQSLRYLFQRHSFTPILPSPAEDLVLVQLIRYEACFQPTHKDLSNRLPERYFNAIVFPQKGEVGELNAKLAKTMYLLQSLKQLKQQCYTFGNKLLTSELVYFASQRQNFDLVMRKTCYEPDYRRHRAIQVADYMLVRCYQLICHLVLKNNLTNKSRLAAFREYGLVVNVDDIAPIKVLTMATMAYVHFYNLMPQILQPKSLVQSDRRQSKRILCYKKGVINLGDHKLICDGAILSLTGAAIRGQTDKPVGSQLSYYIEGFGDMDAILVRKNTEELFVAFNSDDSLKKRFADYLDCYISSLAFN